jgi:hypothetical protein
MEIHVDATTQLDLEVPIGRLKKGSPALDPCLKRRGLFFPGFFL